MLLASRDSNPGFLDWTGQHTHTAGAARFSKIMAPYLQPPQIVLYTSNTPHNHIGNAVGMYTYMYVYVYVYLCWCVCLHIYIYMRLSYREMPSPRAPIHQSPTMLRIACRSWCRSGTMPLARPWVQLGLSPLRSASSMCARVNIMESRATFRTGIGIYTLVFKALLTEAHMLLQIF